MKPLILSLTAVLMITVSAPAADPKPAVDTRVFELRTYYAHPGKMAALDARFRDHTCKLFEKHGMTLIGFWQPVEKADEVLVYLLAFPNLDAAEKAWQAFRNDPEWQKAKTASETDGEIVKKVDRVFLRPTDYSKLK